MKLLVSTIAPFIWVKLDKHDRPIDKGQFIEAAFLNTYSKQVRSVIGVAPSESTVFQQVDVPTKNRSNMLAALPYALEDTLSEDIEQLHFTVLDWVPGGAVKVAVIAHRTLGDSIQEFEDAGVTLDAILSEYSLLPIHPDCDVTIIKQSDDKLLVKQSIYSSFTLDQDAFNDWWAVKDNRSLRIAVNDQALAVELKSQGGEFVNHWAIGSDFRSWLEKAPEQLKTAGSLLHDRYEPEHLKPNNRFLNMGAGLALLALLALGASNWIQANKLQMQTDANQQTIRGMFEKVFPGEEYLDRPRRQIASLLSISEDQPASELFQYLLSISAEVIPDNGAEIEELNYRDEQMQMGVSAPNFASLDQITAQINAREDIQAALISSGTRDQRVTGQIKIAHLRGSQ